MKNINFILKNNIIAIIMILIGVFLYNKISYNITLNKYIKKSKSKKILLNDISNKINGQNKLDNIPIVEDELKNLHPEVQFSVGKTQILAIVSFSLNYRTHDVETLAKDIAIIGGENKILPKE